MMLKPALELLFDDADLIAVAKPAGLATIPGRAETDSVLESLARQIGIPCAGRDDPRLRVVHRLDKETTGVLLFAKHAAAQRFVSHQFQNNLVAKEYLAIVCGRPAETEGEIDAPIAPHPTSPKRMAVVRHGGRPAKTLWRLEQALGPFSLLRCFPRTGKTHQIRVHLQSIGLPLAIDPLYNTPHDSGPAPAIYLSQFKRDYRPTRAEPERPLIDRLTLHAEKLSLTHPDGRPICIVCPPPKDFRATVNQLGKLSGQPRR